MDVGAAKMTLQEAVSVIMGQLVLGDQVRQTLLSALRPEQSREVVTVNAVAYYANLGIHNGYHPVFPGRRPFSEADIRGQMEQFPADVVTACIEAYFACHRVGAKLAGKEGA